MMCDLDLIVACKNGNYDNVINLLQQKYSVHIRDKDNATPLYWSVCRDHLQITKVLISAGSDVNARVTWGSTALHAASDRGHVLCVKALIYSGKCDINIQNKRGDTALHLCSLRGHTEIVKIFIEAGADLFLKNNNGKTPYAEAEGNDFSKIAKLLKQHMLDQKGITFFPNNFSNDTFKEIKTNKQNGHKESVSPNMTAGVVTSHPVFFSDPSRQTTYQDNFVRYKNDMTGFQRQNGAAEMVSVNQGNCFGNKGSYSNNLTPTQSDDLMDEVDGKSNIAAAGTALELRQPRTHDENVAMRASGQYQPGFGCKFPNTVQNSVDDLQLRLIKTNEDLMAKERENEALKRELAIMNELTKQIEQSNKKESSSATKQYGGKHIVVRPPPTTHYRLLQFLSSSGQKSIPYEQTRENDELLKAVIYDHWLAVPAPGGLDLSNKEWFPGSDYFLIGDKPVYITSHELGGLVSMVFRVKHKGYFFNMEMLLYKTLVADNVFSSDSPQFQCRFSSVENYTSIETHRNVLKVRHLFMGSTDRFRKYLNSYFGKNVPKELPSRTFYVVIDDFPFTLKSFLNQQKHLAPFPVHNLDFRFVYILLYQILSAVNDLCKNNAFRCDLTADKVYIDRHLRPIIRGCRISNSPTQDSVIWTTHEDQSVPNTSSLGIAPSSNGLVLPHSDLLVSPSKQHIETHASHLVGQLFYDTLCSPASDVQKTNSLPEHFPPELVYVLRKLTADNPLCRISPRRAMLTVGMILFPVDTNEINTVDTAVHCKARMLKLLALDSKLLRKNNETEHILSMAESVQLLTPEVEADFLYNVTPDEILDIYEELKAAHFNT